MMIRIIVLDQGHVIVCRCEDPQDYSMWVPYTHMRVIRRWGTQHGLNQIANAGPVDSSTVLDELNVAGGKCPVRAIINVIEVNQAKWRDYLDPKSPKSKPMESQ